MNWLEEALSSNKKSKIISYVTHPLYFDKEYKKKIFHERTLEKMRTFIQENKDNMEKIEEGYTTYKYELDDYKKILQEEGISIVLGNTLKN